MEGKAKAKGTFTFPLCFSFCHNQDTIVEAELENQSIFPGGCCSALRGEKGWGDSWTLTEQGQAVIPVRDSVPPCNSMLRFTLCLKEQSLCIHFDLIMAV